jgi:hypothetical protein
MTIPPCDPCDPATDLPVSDMLEKGSYSIYEDDDHVTFVGNHTTVDLTKIDDFEEDNSVSAMLQSGSYSLYEDRDCIIFSRADVSVELWKIAVEKTAL